MSQQFTKDPEATLDYAVDWTRWLSGDTIQTSEWTVPAGLTQVNASNTTTKATIWLSGGTAGQSYTVTNRITTAAGRTDERSITIRVQDR
ncbi:MAG: hypothetical protein HYX72_14345 [Acidobacteria bacterium]|nr:hypothetical protein [Acidobacteriota bacterium]